MTARDASVRELRLSELVGRPVRDVDGHSLGRIHDVRAEIVLHERGNDYVVVELCVGRSRIVEMLCGGRFVPPLLRAIGRHAGARFRIPWAWMDLDDVRRPRCTRRRDELPHA